MTPGSRVRVAIPRNQPCHPHSLETVPVLGAIGTVDRVDERLGEHGVMVVFDRRHLGTQWTDRDGSAEARLVAVTDDQIELEAAGNGASLSLYFRR